MRASHDDAHQFDDGGVQSETRGEEGPTDMSDRQPCKAPKVEGIYVDEIREWPTRIRCFKGGSCHLTADHIEALHKFARKLRLKPEWFQDTATPHYDLTVEKRAKALALGAVYVPARVQAKRRIAIRNCTTPSGRKDGHNAYIENINGEISCAFCKQPWTLRSAS